VNKTIGASGDFLHKEYPKQFKRDDFWRQIKRTINGQPASDSDIRLIVDQIEDRLELGRDDCLLDLGCGNGALGSQLFAKVNTYCGVDFSEYLLEIAREYFTISNRISWCSADIRDVSSYVSKSLLTTKVLLYGCIAYLEKADVGTLLSRLSEELPSLQKVFIGNIPWQKQSAQFFKARNVYEYDLDNAESPIGVWWDVEEFLDLAEQTGFRATSYRMPSKFYGSQYRFDMLMER
jgi:cyclopropane fatty-acyl-phospholipid synthase-like methyltransferase